MLNEIVLLCATFYGRQFGIEPKLIQAIAKVESNLDPSAKSPDRQDIGLMQVRASHVPESTDELLDTCTNIKVATRILAEAKKRCIHKHQYTYVLCYNRGIFGATKVKHPMKDVYYQRVMKKLRSLNYARNYQLEELGETLFRKSRTVPYR